MSARRLERQPSGRSNVSEINTARSGYSQYTSRTNRSQLSSRGQASARSEASEISTNELLRRMREKSDGPKQAAELAALDALGEYNPFSRPRRSIENPLRSVFLDPDINNFAKCRTMTELKARIKASGTPHPSYDLDGDGYVSQEDYRLAKRFDFDGNGVLDPEERKIGQRVLAEEFFRRNNHQVEKFGGSIGFKTHKENVEQLINAHSFERSYEKLLEKERSLIAESSKPIYECMTIEGTRGEPLLAHNFYTNKFDATAYNDIDAVPRASQTLGLNDHGGSRKRLLFTRKEIMRSDLQEKINRACDKQKLPNTRRISLITNTAIENS